MDRALPRGLLLFAAAICVVSGLGAWLAMGRHGGSAQATPPAPKDSATRRLPGGCRITDNSSGYPDYFITHSGAVLVHPPLPSYGWRGPKQTVGMPVLFHNLFHGYLEVGYRSTDLSAARTVLKPWVARHADRRDRVLAVADIPGSRAALYAAAWGHELTCPAIDEPAIAALDRLVMIQRAMHGA